MNTRAALLQVGFDAAPLIGKRFELHLPGGEARGQARLNLLQAGQLSGGAFLFFASAGGVAVHGGQVLVDLRELIAQRGSFAQEFQDMHPGSFNSTFALAKGGLVGVTLGCFCFQKLARGDALLFQILGSFLMDQKLGLLLLLAEPQASGLRSHRS